ncbi:uncharacterized protein LOC122940975 [Bufo gargarizans]|uniref:uncharacterized protein LOC122940975 n=1 Tax=Bufo gargarizans TaxID=30331 RepID=UPI001CF2647B|nr:uncharacterized protein LOC122940975 [Bufo gargarizans]
MQKSVIFIFAVIYFKVTIHGLENDLLEVSNTQGTELAKNRDNPKDMSYKSLQKKLKHFIDLDKDLTNLTLSQIDSLIWWTQQALNSLKGYQSKVYDKTVRTTNCTMPLVPTNGGLVCAYLDNAYFCKPMCDQGYDFSFLRRSRLYEICGRQTGFSWTSQYVGGNRLAECTAADVAISGQSSAYFKNKKCQEALSMGIEDTYINEFIKELEENGITNNHKKDLDIVVCG